MGYSYAGFLISTKLWDHVSITVIDKRDYFENVCVSIKGAIDHPLVDNVLFA